MYFSVLFSLPQKTKKKKQKQNSVCCIGSTIAVDGGFLLPQTVSRKLFICKMPQIPASLGAGQ